MTSAKLSFPNKVTFTGSWMWTYLLGGHQSPHYKIETSLPGGRGGVGNALQEVSVISGERGHCGGSGRWGAQRCLRARDLAWQVQRQPDAAGKSLELRSQVYRGAMVWIAVLEGSVRRHQARGPIGS